MERTDLDLAALTARLDQLEARMAHLEARVNKAAHRFSILHDRVDLLDRWVHARPGRTS